MQCSAVLRVGNYDDGGWTLCNVPPYIPEQDNCIVYSFGLIYTLYVTVCIVRYKMK